MPSLFTAIYQCEFNAESSCSGFISFSSIFTYDIHKSLYNTYVNVCNTVCRWRSAFENEYIYIRDCKEFLTYVSTTISMHANFTPDATLTRHLVIFPTSSYSEWKVEVVSGHFAFTWSF